jgi:CRISPR-associated endonuclease/helicase Cas3
MMGKTDGTSSGNAPDGRGDFDQAFKALTGHDAMPWQVALYERFIRGDFPSTCTLPTGLGKTSVMAIWLIALAHSDGRLPSGRRLPGRLVYVVNRRTVVDQATDVAKKLRENLREDVLVDLSNRLWKLCATKDNDLKASPLAISTLRGQFADNGDWRADPARPAIIIGTVDMIGSRLLFSGYRAGSWQLARHAGLIGHDALIVHDEAHLEPVFQELVEWVGKRQQSDGSPQPIRVMAMSATGRESDGPDMFTLGQDDLQHTVVRQRYSEVKKALYLHTLVPKAKSFDELVKLAWKHAEDNVRVIVYVRTPAVAKAVRDGLVDRLAKAGQGEDAGNRVALLTGTIRGHEREGLLGHPAVLGLLNSHDAQGSRIAPGRTTWLVATSAGEVGADFDADHMICDLTTMEAMIQRLGRVNRRGGSDRTARIDVVLDLPGKGTDKSGNEKELSPFQQARLVAAGLLEKLPNMPSDGIGTTAEPPRNAAPAALRKLVQQYPVEYAKACAPRPASILPHDVVLDAWALTSIQEDWPLAHAVHPYLHGLVDSEPETHVAWRAELDELPSGDDAEANALGKTMDAILKHYPLRPLELLRESPERVAKLLVALGEVHPRKWVVRIRQRFVSLQRLGELPADEKQLKSQLHYETVILPCSVGGLDSAGMIELPAENAKTVARVTDVADLSPSDDGKQFEVTRQRVHLSRDDEGQWRYRVVTADAAPAGSSGHEPLETYPQWTAARDAAKKALGMKCADHVVLGEDDAGPAKRLLFLRTAPRPRNSAGGKSTISAHDENVRQVVGRLTAALALEPELQQAFDLAAAGHDLGKADPRWQQAIGNLDMGKPLAKSFGEDFNARRLNGYRHEFGSLRRIIGQLPDNEAGELALHLVAAHHGRGRPHFEPPAMAGPDGLPEEFPPLLAPAEMARRFARLQRRFGHWGLAWLESILMAADAEASAAPAAGDEDEEDES